MVQTLKTKRYGFTLIELLTVIGIIGILVGILVPVTQSVRAAARRASCQNNMRQLMLSMLDHENLNGHFPKADNGNGGSLFVGLLAHLDQKVLFERSIADLNIGETYQQRWEDLSRDRLDILFCPSSNDSERLANTGGDGLFSTTYYGVAGPVNPDPVDPNALNYPEYDTVGGPIALSGLFAPDRNGKFTLYRGSKDALDGAAVTFAIGEISRFSLTSGGGLVTRAGWAFGSQNNESDELELLFGAKSIEFDVNSGKGITNNVAFNSPHSGGAQFGFVDASVRFVKDTISAGILREYASTNGRERIRSLDE